MGGGMAAEDRKEVLGWASLSLGSSGYRGKPEAENGPSMFAPRFQGGDEFICADASEGFMRKGLKAATWHSMPTGFYSDHLAPF